MSEAMPVSLKVPSGGEKVTIKEAPWRAPDTMLFSSPEGRESCSASILPRIVDVRHPRRAGGPSRKRERPVAQNSVSDCFRNLETL